MARPLKNAMIRHSDETVLLVRSIYKLHQFGYKRIEKLTGIAESTIRQWILQTTRAAP